MRTNKIFLITASVLVFAAMIFGGFYLYKNNIIKPIKNLTDLAQNGLPGQLFGPKSPQKAASLDPTKILYWTNYYRNQNGELPPLTINNTLVKAAQAKTADMFAKQYFEHVSPSGVSPSNLVSATGYNYKTTGENLALGDFKDEKDLVDAWMASPGHRANILNVDYTEIGIATGLDTFQDRGKTWLAVQEFGKPLANCKNPDANTLNDINSKKTEYDNLISQINTLSTEASNLNSQANAKIQQGNEIYASTHDASKAQPYWDEGSTLRTQANNDITKAKSLQDQASSLLNDYQKESDIYNAQVNSYNSCIKQ